MLQSLNYFDLERELSSEEIAIIKSVFSNQCYNGFCF